MYTIVIFFAFVQRTSRPGSAALRFRLSRGGLEHTPVLWTTIMQIPCFASWHMVSTWTIAIPGATAFCWMG